MANNLTRFNPFGDLTGTETWRDFEDIFRRVPVVGSLAGNTPPSIRLDVNESEQAYQVSAEVPGIKKEDVHVSVEGNVVTIRVESRREQEEKDGDTVLRSERYFGVQTRRFSLAQDIDESQASAKCENGILELTLPKKKGGTGAKKLEIR
ncbi:Hsp20/alpha crystallin family protein [Alcaligenes aquatilis]|uniref:Hsp20/alpha crystallin family protein n=1 Tax=Alcaligenes aquatilis TaxID=323284 RepID=A0A3G2HV76_9BURK|nr:Hsp20/alpha crystallin family protein [Alcaligenes aquatilis]AYN20909.1 Hsp20/alpha crystallin family protein [Alcaligenes aquatilis]